MSTHKDEKENQESNEARQKLLAVAGKLFAEKGLDGVTTRDIARDSGLNISLISYYFGGKEGLYRAVLLDFGAQGQRRLGIVLKDFDEEKMTKESFLTHMKQIILGIGQMKVENPHVMELMQREVLSGLPYARELHDTIFRSLAERIVGVIQTAQKKTFFNPEIHPYVLFLAIVHAQDMYFAVNRCDVGIMDKCPKIPEQANEYAEQIFKIFIQGHIR